MPHNKTAGGDQKAEAQIAELSAQHDKVLASVRQESQSALKFNDEEFQSKITRQRLQLEAGIEQGAASVRRLQVEHDHLLQQLQAHVQRSEVAERRAEELGWEVEKLKVASRLQSGSVSADSGSVLPPPYSASSASHSTSPRCTQATATLFPLPSLAPMCVDQVKVA